MAIVILLPTKTHFTIQCLNKGQKLAVANLLNVCKHPLLLQIDSNSILNHTRIEMIGGEFENVEKNQTIVAR